MNKATASSNAESEEEVIARVLNRIDGISQRRVEEGFSEKNFALGVLNCFALIYVFGRFPQHFWLLCMVELLYLFPKRFYDSWNSKPLKTILYYLDYCWIMNFIFVAFLLMVVFGWTIQWEDTFRYQAFQTMYGVACGPLFGAAVLLPFVAALFHDFRIMTDMFIHVLPLAILYTAKWHTTEIQQAYPSIVDLSYMDHIKFFPQGRFFILPCTYLGTVAGNTLALYVVWFVPYVIFMTLIGIKLPRKNRTDKNGVLVVPKYDTVFHSTVRKGVCAAIGTVFWKRPVAISEREMDDDDYELRDFVLYMMFHALGVYLSVFFLAYPCYRSQVFHATVLVLLTILAVARGAQRYTYYVVNMYGKLIRKEFVAELASVRGAQDYGSVGKESISSESDPLVSEAIP